jgi:TP901 family phage tail tape measure protein
MSLKVDTIFTAIDKFTAPLERMAESMGAFGNAADSAAGRVERRFRKIGSAAESVAKTSFVIGAAVAAPLVLAAKSAIDFEDKMADVAKVANVTLGSNQFIELGNQAKDLGVFLGVGAKEAAGLMANLAQGGVAIEDLDKVSRIAGKMGVAFGISADIAGEAFIKTKNALGGTIEETERLMDSLNHLGNTTAASSANLVTFMSSGGSAAARAAGATGEAMAGMGAQLISMGKSAEESATIMERFVKKALNEKDLRGTFDAVGGGSAGMLAIIEKGAKMSGKAQDTYFQKFGEYGLSVQLLAKNFEGLKSTVDAATNAQLTQDSVLNEFNNRTGTTAFKLQQAQAQFEVLAIEIGSVLLPVLNSFIQKVSPIITGITKWAQENKGLVKTIVLAAAAFATFALAISGIASLIALFSKAMVIATTAQAAFNFVMSMNPVSLIIIGIAALIALIAIIIAKWDEWGAAVSLFLGPLGWVISLIQSFRRNWDLIKDAFASGGILEGIKMIGKTLLDAVLQPLQQLLSLIGKITGSEMITKAATDLQNFRAELGVNMGAELVNPEQAKQEGLKETINTQRQNVNIDINDKTGRANMSSDNNLVPVQMTSTFAF